MLAGPFADLGIRPIGVSVVARAVAIAFVQPGLVLALELVVEADPLDAGAAVRQALRGALVRAIDVQVVSQLALAFHAMPEGLAGTLIAVAVAFDQAPAVLRQRDRMLARSRHADGLDEPLLTQMSQVA